MHHIHHTEGIVLSSREFGESGKGYFIFTRDLGMVFATASGVRKMSSKLRYILQDFAYLKIDLVEGKDIWRVTSASKTNQLEDILKNKEALIVFANMSRLLKRLLSGEYPNQELFDDLLGGLFILEQAITKEEIHSIEAVMVLRILNNLGYVGENNAIQSFVKSPLAQNLVYEAVKERKSILQEINKALKETHL